MGEACRLLAAMALALAAGAAPAHARLPAPPFDLRLSPSRVVEGDATTIVVASQRTQAGAERYDLYVVWAYAEEAAFLTPEGGWAPQPVALARGVSPQTFTPHRVAWRGVRPVMDIALALVVVPVNVAPLDRTHWRFSPVVRWVSVGRARAWPALGPEAGLLALAAAGGCILILAVATRW